MNNDVSAYGLWALVIVNSAIFIFFAFSFTKPKTKRDWGSLGAFSAFVVALFAEMYGFPLTIYFLSGWLQSSFPETDIFSHANGHIWNTLFGFQGNPHFNPIHLISSILILVGFILVAASWRVLHKAQAEEKLATSGPYSSIRHPQYVGFIMVMLGFLMQWPTILTLAMFPVLIAMYMHLAAREEREVRLRFKEEYAAYAAVTPAFLPHIHALTRKPVN